MYTIYNITLQTSSNLFHKLLKLYSLEQRILNTKCKFLHMQKSDNATYLDSNCNTCVNNFFSISIDPRTTYGIYTYICFLSEHALIQFLCNCAVILCLLSFNSHFVFRILVPPHFNLKLVYLSYHIVCFSYLRFFFNAGNICIFLCLYLIMNFQCGVPEGGARTCGMCVTRISRKMPLTLIAVFSGPL